MAGVPVFFRKSGEGAVASYDWYDFSQGLGYKDFYGMMQTSGALITERIYSDKLDTGTKASGTGVKTTLVFTTQFQNPSIIKGDAFVCVPLHISNGSGTFNTYASCSIIQQSNGINTTLGQGNTGNFISTTGGDTSQIKTAQITLPYTRMKSQDKIILIIDHMATAFGTGTITIMHDPANRTPTQATSTMNPDIGYSASETSNLILAVPFQIDL